MMQNKWVRGGWEVASMGGGSYESPRPRGEGGGGWEWGSSVRGLDFGCFIFGTNIGNLFSSNRGQMTTFQTPIDALIPKM